MCFYCLRSNIRIGFLINFSVLYNAYIHRAIALHSRRKYIIIYIHKIYRLDPWHGWTTSIMYTTDTMPFHTQERSTERSGTNANTTGKYHKVYNII